MGLAGSASAQQFQQQGPSQPAPLNPAQGQVAPQQQPQGSQAPFVLSPQEQAQLDQILLQWQSRSQAIKNFKCQFNRLEYDLVFGPKQWVPNPAGKVDLKPRHISESVGELSYESPDKGLFKVSDIRVWKAAPAPAGAAPKGVAAGTYEKPETEMNEQWVCDGKSVYRFDPALKKVTQYELPPEMQGKGIADGPLPFLFGAEAAKLKARYWMRNVTPARTSGQLWLLAIPQWQQDAANFQSATLILNTPDFSPFALQVKDPGGNKETVYTFDKIEENKGGFFHRGFSVPRTPFGWTKVIEQPPSAGPQSAQSTVPVQGGQAQQPQLPTRR
jgi:TIGR03009 family protein